MQQSRSIQVIIAAILGLVFLVVSYIYFTHQAQNLPSFFPGHTAGLTKVHSTHAIASLVVGLAFLAFAWFQSGPKKA
jgi:amino acid permease